ncbi:MAG TPA: hydantoinase/oxoprolinase family protein [Terriglobales bacterium]|nr:hydantoinase/oxoprolinase family protein [Terriglobales bacterium]
MERSPRKKSFRIAIDTGGTFTDCVWAENGRLRMLKVFSTPADPSEAIASALKRIGVADGFILLHGTTVGTNTLLERKGARIALVTTAGFEDAIEIGRQARPRLYDFFFERVEPLVLHNLRFGVAERTASDGEILQSPTPDGLRTLYDKLLPSKPEAIAISLLFSFANENNELAVAAVLRDLGVPLSVSHQILPEFREAERTSTVVVNAYLQPIMQRYLGNLQSRAADVCCHATEKPRVFVMQSSGGITALESAAHEPVRTVLSGPAGGVIGAAAMARASGFSQIISFDMGGTSTDVSLVDGAARTSSQSEVAGFSVAVPILDIHTVGAGGGSIARFDAAGALRVGPESAGADPGPICYGKGLQPTVTDANLLLGRLQPKHFLGGEFILDLDRTRAIVTQWLKKHASSLTLEKFAAGVIRVVNATMEKAIRVVSIERGYDTREFTLVAFGGAGGLHACDLARALSIPRVIIPALPGALSAYGILVSDVVKDYSRTVLWEVPGKLPKAQLNEEFLKLRNSAATEFREENWRGNIRFQKTVDLRYRGQGFELNLRFSSGLLDAFHKEHERRYGYSHPEREVELVTLRLRASLPPPRTKLAVQPDAQAAVRAKPLRSAVNFEGKAIRSDVWERSQLQRGKRYSGPAVITEYSATTVVPPGARFQIDKANSVVIDL